ncbi:hypothetical protein AX16_008306, partial [Volvariella volvacea WC 439]
MPVHSLSAQQAYSISIVSGVGCHLIFTRVEPRSAKALSTLLVVIPSCVSVLLCPCFPSLLTAFATTLSLYVSVLVLSTIAYRLSPFHPLSSYPGPLICRVSKMWMAYVAFMGKQHFYIQQLHSKYGDIIRTGPNELSFADAGLIQPLLGAHGLPKSSFWDGQFSHQKSHRTLIGIRDPKIHAGIRKIWSRGFSAEALKGYQALVQKRTSQLIETLQKAKGKEIDLSAWINWLSHDIMSDMVFGSGPEMLENQDFDDVWRLMNKGQSVGVMIAHMPWFGENLMKIPAVARELLELTRHSLERIQQHQQNRSRYKDLVYYLMDEEGQGVETLAPEQLANDSILAIVAGSDTVATALPNMLWLLVRHAVAYRRLLREVDALGNKIDDVVELGKLPYLNAVMLYDCIHQSPAVALALQTEKWRDRAWGPTDCIGKRLAMQELRTISAAILQAFDVKFAPGYDSLQWEKELRDYIVTHRGKLPVLLTNNVSVQYLKHRGTIPRGFHYYLPHKIVRDYPDLHFIPSIRGYATI